MSLGDTDSDYLPRNPETATTEAYSHMDDDVSSVSSDSGSSLIDDYLDNFQGIVCRQVPVFQEAQHISAQWVAGELPGIINWPQWPLGQFRRYLAYCHVCRLLTHIDCILAGGSCDSIALVGELMLSALQVYPIRDFTYKNCRNNNQP